MSEPRLQVMRDSAGQIAGLALYGKRPANDFVLLEALRVNPLENDALVYRIGIIEVFPDQAGREEVLRQLMASVARASLEDTALKYNLNGLVYAPNPAESNGRDAFFSAGFQPVVDDLVDMEMVSRSKTGYEGLPEVYLSKDQAEKLTREAAVAEQGETVSPAAGEARRNGEEAVGGIDLNPVQMDFQIRRDGEGVPLALPQQPLENINIDGFLPVIINISPATNLPLLLGIAEPQGAPYAALSL